MENTPDTKDMLMENHSKAIIVKEHIVEIVSDSGEGAQ